MKAAYFRLPLAAGTRARHLRLMAFLAPQWARSQGVVVSPYRTKVPLSMSARVDRQRRALQATLDFELPLYETPQVSVIVPVHDQLAFTLDCLKSIALSAPATPFEVLVVDDASQETTREALGGIKGLRLISHSENEGFIRSCNTGAQAAKGQYLLFLNNDTVVMPGWLDTLVETFAQIPGTGLVGSRLVFPDGTLQEAGCLIWQDGTPWMIGRFQDADLPAYHYAREVDYCSGASLMIPRTLFDELGGFDTHYCPAYCEDADLGLKVRQHGYRVIYQPFSTVIHWEGMSNGRSTHTGVKAWQTINIQKFRKRWSGQLNTQGEGPAGFDRAKDRTMKGRALFLTADLPQDALTLQQQGFQVTWFPGDGLEPCDPRIENLQRRGVEVLYRPFEPSAERHLKHQGSRYQYVVLGEEAVATAQVARRYCPQAQIVQPSALADMDRQRPAPESPLIPAHV
ncbi:MAG: glycosyltransferase family 2 protein [Saprospiraceae bacterium]